LIFFTSLTSVQNPALPSIRLKGNAQASPLRQDADNGIYVKDGFWPVKSMFWKMNK